LWDLTPKQHLDLYDLAKKHGQKCCFVHGLGLPEKDGHRLPMFDYEKKVYDKILEFEQLWIKKATGLGITEFFLYFMLWLALCKPRGWVKKGITIAEWLKDSHMVIVTGIREEFAKEVIQRAKNKLEKALIILPKQDDDTTIRLDDVVIKAYPSFNQTWRGLDKISFIFIDEADFFKDSEQEEVRHVAERYIGKSGAWIAMVSTPNKPGGLFERMENDPNDRIYHKMFLHWEEGKGKIYSDADIATARLSPMFPREYEGKYLGGQGTVFAENKIQACINPEYDPLRINPYALRSMGVDPGWGVKSPFGIVATQFSNNRVEVLEAKEHVGYHDYNVMVEEMYTLHRQINSDKVIIDGSASDVVSSFKSKIGEEPDYMHDREETRKRGFKWEDDITCLPLFFGRQNKQLLTHTKMLIDNGLVSIHPSFDKLITFLRTAQEKQGTIDKDKTSYHDIGDAFMMSLWYYQIE
jgi:hypothetical protein